MNFTEWEQKADEHQKAVEEAAAKVREAQAAQTQFLLETTGVNNQAEITIKAVAGMVAKIIEMKK